MKSILVTKLSEEVKKHLKPFFMQFAEKASINQNEEQFRQELFFQRMDSDSIAMLEILLLSYYSLPLKRHLQWEYYPTTKWSDITDDTVIIGAAQEIFFAAFKYFVEKLHLEGYSLCDLQKGDRVFIHKPTVPELCVLDFLGIQVSETINMDQLNESNGKFDYMFFKNFGSDNHLTKELFERCYLGRSMFTCGYNFENHDIVSVLRNHLDNNGKAFVFIHRSTMQVDYMNPQSSVYQKKKELIDSGFIKKVSSIKEDVEEFYWISLDRQNNEVISFESTNLGKQTSIEREKLNGTLLVPDYYIEFPVAESGYDFYRLSELMENITPVAKQEKGDFVVYGFNSKYGDIVTVGQEHLEFHETMGYKTPTDCILIRYGEDIRGLEFAKVDNGLYNSKECFCTDYTSAWRLKRLDLVSVDYILYAVSNDFFINQQRYIQECEYNDPHYINYFLNRIDDCWIKVPSKVRQEEILIEAASKRSEIAKQKQENNFVEYRKDVHMKKHALGQTLSNLNNWFDCLNTLREKYDGYVKGGDTIGRTQPISVDEILENISNCLNQANMQLEGFTVDEDMSKELFILNDFLKDYVVKHKNPLFEYEVIIDEKVKGIEFPRKALTQILDNIISNACCHGFNIHRERKNTIRFQIESVTGVLDGENVVKTVLVVSNNGQPMNPSMSQEKVFAYGGTSSSSHTGIGAHQVKLLMDKYSGQDTVEIINDPDAEYPVSYKLVLQYVKCWL